MVNNPDTNMVNVMPMVETITSGRLLKRFKSQAFNKDMKNLVNPTNIEAWKAFTVLPASFSERKINLI